MNVRLIKLTKEYKKQLTGMIEEWQADIAAHHTNGSPWVIFKNDHHDFEHYLEQQILGSSILLDIIDRTHKRFNGKFVGVIINVLHASDAIRGQCGFDFFDVFCHN